MGNINGNGPWPTHIVLLVIGKREDLNAPRKVAHILLMAEKSAP